jgi:hypothetical protein
LSAFFKIPEYGKIVVAAVVWSGGGLRIAEQIHGADFAVCHAARIAVHQTAQGFHQQTIIPRCGACFADRFAQYCLAGGA